MIQSRWRETSRPFVSVLFVAVALYLLLQSVGVLTVCSGACLFLFAMKLLEQSFKILSGGILEVFLEKVADKNYKSFLFGFTLSSLVQSSGLVTIIAISFLSAGLITLAAGVAMVLGINLSTAGSAWFVGYFGLKSKISLYAMPFIVFGVIFYLKKHRKTHGFGLFLLSLGLLFLGISWMKEGFVDFKDTIDISQYQMDGFVGLLVYTLVGFVVTAITQSSHATLTLAIAALTVGQVSYENSIGIAIGASVGSTIITCIGALNANINGKKIAITHVFFNVLSAALSIIFIDYYLLATDWIAPYMGIAADDWVFKLAIFTSLFNIAGVLLLSPFINQMCDVLNRVVVSRNAADEADKPRFLNKSSLAYAETALETLQAETEHLLQNTMDIVATMVSVRPADISSTMPASEVVKQNLHPIEEPFDELYHKRFKVLYSDIMDYAVHAVKSDGMNEANSHRLMELRRASIIMATAVKKSQQLNVNILRYGFSRDSSVVEEYAHIRRNLVRLIRFVHAMKKAQTAEDLEAVRASLAKHKNKFDALSSNSLDNLIRSHMISDEVATSIMNDNALSRSISKNLTHIAEIITRTHRLD